MKPTKEHLTQAKAMKPNNILCKMFGHKVIYTPSCSSEPEGSIWCPRCKVVMLERLYD
jgi:hypothetical protein